jgi:uncharacterized protein (DUF58 family)
MKFFRSLYISPRFFAVLVGIIIVFILGFSFPFLVGLGQMLVMALALLLLLDLLLLYKQSAITAQRICAEKLSNGDDNEILIRLKNDYNFSVDVAVIDEIPHQFQLRNFLFKEHLPAGQEKTLQYFLRPVRRGEYEFGSINVYVNTVLGLFIRRYEADKSKIVKVYPSYLQLRKYELYAISNRLTELGIKKIRKIGLQQEFEQIKEYVQGDDLRTINWKATARKNNLMTNQYTDEKAQHVYSVIDKGRVMKMPFKGMTLLDYAINSSLVISNIAIQKSDKAGIITFNTKISTLLAADNKQGQMTKVLENLYNQKTAYQESDYEALFMTLRTQLKQRSLVLLYTNFEGLASLERQINYFKSIAKQHLLVVIFFENTELKTLLDSRPVDDEEIYTKTIAQKFAYEKKLIVRELAKYGIHAILTAPENLTVNTINKYLELKARNLI